MCKTMQKILYLVLLLLLIRANNGNDNGDDVKCVCSDKNVAFITTMSGRIVPDESVSPTRSENKILERLESIVDTLKSKNSFHIDCNDISRNAQTFNQNRVHPISCAEAAANSRRSGVYNIQLDSIGSKPFQVSCEETLYGGGWTVVLRRKDGKIDFYRDWSEYKHGFGNIEGEFFIGLDKLYALTNGPYTQEVLFVLEDFDNVQKYARYTSFAIGDESERYVLKILGEYSGDAGDSFTFQAGHTFKTKDVEDLAHNCSQTYLGAWWYSTCHASNLCGKYLSGTYSKDQYAQGVVWQAFRGHYYSLKFAMMMIRPQRVHSTL